MEGVAAGEQGGHPWEAPPPDGPSVLVQSSHLRRHRRGRAGPGVRYRPRAHLSVTRARAAPQGA